MDDHGTGRTRPAGVWRARARRRRAGLSSGRGSFGRLRRALRSSEARYRTVVEAASDVIVTIDAESRILFVNAAVERVFGYSPDELIRRELTTLMPERLRGPHREGLVRYCASGARRLDWSGVDLIGKTRDGVEIPVEVSFGEHHEGSRREFTGIIRDVGARRRAEAALHAERELVERILDSVESGVVVCDADGILERFNRKTQQWHGADAERCHAGEWPERYGLYHADGVTRMQPDEVPLLRALRGEEIVDVEMTIVPKSGTPRLVSTNARAMYAADGTKLGAVAVMHDITLRKRSEEQILQSARLESVGRLAGGVAHEANNQMMVVLASADFLLSRSGLSSEVVEDVVRIQNAAERTAMITSQLLAFSRKQRLDLSPLDLNGVVADVAPDLRRALGEEIALDLVLRAGLAHVRADEVQLTQVLENLVLNARDAISGRGRVVIETGLVEVPESGPRPHAEVGPGVYAQLLVTDTGHGMEEETMNHIFDPFFTTKEPGEGSGMGLASAYGVLKQSGGHICVRSTPGEGTTFELYFELA